MQSSTGTTRFPPPIQIRVHDDRLRIYNPGTIPVPAVAKRVARRIAVLHEGRDLPPTDDCLRR